MKPNDSPKTVIPMEAQVEISNFHSSISCVVHFVQFFGIMPLRGTTSNHIRDVHFDKKSPQFFFALYNVATALLMAMCCLAKFAVDGLVLADTAIMSFYICNFFGAVQLIQVASKWNSLLKEAFVAEKYLKNYICLFNVKKRFQFITILVLSFALVEHLLFVLNNIYVTVAQCKNYYKYPLETYFGVAFPSVFTLIDYAHWLAFITELANILSTVTWNFIDLFIILISCFLAMGFSKINKRLEEKASMKEEFWKEIREDYNRMAQLTSFVDKHLGPLLLISFIDNTFFICIQLYNSLRERVGVVETIYYFFSFGFLLGRTLAVALFGAWIYEESRRPLPILNSIPTEYYCVEVERFIEQMVSAPAGLTGSKYFLLSRHFMLKIASTIVTFELMLLEFGPLTKNYRKDNGYVCIRDDVQNVTVS